MLTFLLRFSCAVITMQTRAPLWGWLTEATCRRFGLVGQKVHRQCYLQADLCCWCLTVNLGSASEYLNSPLPCIAPWADKFHHGKELVQLGLKCTFKTCLAVILTYWMYLAFLLSYSDQMLNVQMIKMYSIFSHLYSHTNRICTHD